VEAGKQGCVSHKGYGFFSTLSGAVRKDANRTGPSGVEQVLVEVLVVLKFEEDIFLVCRRREL
jgi:hypothetical protein